VVNGRGATKVTGKMIRRAPWWFPPLSFVAITALVCFISFFHPWSPTPLMPFAVTGQLCLLLIIVRAFGYWPPFARWIAAMPLAHRIVLGVLIGGMILGHYTFNGRTFFPFVVWEIFPQPEKGGTVTAQEFIGTTASGAKVRLLAEQLFPSIVQIDRVESLDQSFGPGTRADLALAMAQMYNTLHAADPVRKVDLVEVAVNLHPPAGESRTEPSCELLKSYDVSSAPSR
jgi:hypothetical protein